jgi:hypothetical protein
MKGRPLPEAVVAQIEHLRDSWGSISGGWPLAIYLQIWQSSPMKLVNRTDSPVQLVSTVLYGCEIIHTRLAWRLARASSRMRFSSLRRASRRAFVAFVELVPYMNHLSNA